MLILKKYWKGIGLIFITCWLLSSLLPTRSSAPALNVWMLNVGQGESVLVQEPNGEKLLFDGGPDDSVLSQLGTILPPWDHTLDLVILSHNHSDHIRGLISVLNRYKVKEIWVSGAINSTGDYQAFTQSVRKQSIPEKIVWFDQEKCLPLPAACPPITPFGQAYLQVYHPLEDMTGQLPENQHDATVVVKVSFASQSLLLAGDLNEEHEEAMLAACQAPACNLKSNVLQVPHHGSATGLTQNFLDTIHPEIALIPVGLNNKFHHPTEVILDRLHQAAVPIYRTDLQGQIHVVMPRDGPLKVTTEKG